MGNLVVLRKQDKEEVPVTTSDVIAKECKVKHHAVQQLVNTYENDLKEFGVIAFDMRKPKLSKRGIEEGRPETIYFLNEQQTTLLITYMKNTPIVRKFKIELVKQFYAMRSILIQKQTTEWIEARQETKDFTKQLNATVKPFVEYCKTKGSSKPDMYYKHFASLCNRIVAIKDGQRDMAGIKQLRYQTLVMELIEHTISEAMQSDLYYKDIFQLCKSRVEEISNLIPSLKQISA